MQRRREFIAGMVWLAGSAPLLPFMPKAKATDSILSKNSISTDDDFWSWVRQEFTASPNMLNLNNGGVSPQPKTVQDAFERYYRLCNEAPAYYMWRILDQGREPLRMRLAELAGCSPEEIALNRNTTESLDTVIFGLDLKKGDEVILSKQDYPNVINAWKQREKRDGIKITWINLDIPCEDDDLIVSRYTAAFNSRTRIVNITHIVNWSGQILPARKIADAAHARNIEVIVDGAHSFAHLVYKIRDLDCDYFGTSLHKWLCAPFGTGMLFVKKEKIKSIWPLYPNDKPESDDIRKFESLGTRNFAAEQAIGQAIDFHYSIGARRKEDRLRFLKNYWAEKAIQIPKVKLITSLKPEYSCGIANFAIEGKKPGEIGDFLFNKYKIVVTPIDWENISGVRITPHLYTSTEDLNRLVTGIEECAK